MSKEVKSSLPPDVQARIDFVRSVVPKRNANKLLKSIVASCLVLVVIVILWLILSPNSAKPKPKTPVVSYPIAVALSPSSPTASYTSKYFGVTLSYPKAWSLSDSRQGTLNIVSPLTKLVADTGEQVSGKITMSILKQGSLPAALTAGNDLAVLDSNIISYANPSSDQSGQTYVSYVQYSSTSVVGGLNAVYVTGNYGYQKDGVIPTSDINNMNPLVIVSFNECTSKLCDKFTPLTIKSSSWSGTSLGQIITNIIESFVFN